MIISKFFSIVITVCLSLASIPLIPHSMIAEAATTTSGTCGDNLTWNFSDGVLTISGVGTMMEGELYSDYHGQIFALTSQRL